MFSKLTVSFPNTRVQPQRVYRLSYRQTNYEHDFAKVYFRDWGLDISRVRPGSPMKIALDSKEFVGYVHDIKTYRESNKDFTEVSFIGASYVMRQSSQQTFKNVTASHVAEKLAKKYGFAYKIEQHPRVYPQISQAGLTDWELLVKLAKQCGYFFRVEATTLYFQPIPKVFEDYVTEAPVYSQVDAGFKNPNLLYSFTPNIGETLGHSGADKSATSVAGVHPETGQYFKYTSQKRPSVLKKISQPELFDRHATSTVAPSYDVAVYESVSIDEKSRFPYAAEAEILGTTRLVVGGPIYLQGVGNTYSGYWTVLEITHEVIEDKLNLYKYTSNLFLGTDSLGELATNKYPRKPSSRGVRNLSPTMKDTKKAAKNVVKTPTIKTVPTKNIKLVDRVNRAVSSGPAVGQSTWASTSGNLNTTKVTASRSSVASAKVGKRFAK